MLIEQLYGTLEWLAGSDQGNAEELSMGRMVMLPGTTNELHAHANCEELIYVVRGRVEHNIDGRTIQQTAGEVRIVPKGTSHMTTNTGKDEAELLIFFSSASREYAKL